MKDETLNDILSKNQVGIMKIRNIKNMIINFKAQIYKRL